MKKRLNKIIKNLFSIMVVFLITSSGCNKKQPEVVDLSKTELLNYVESLKKDPPESQEEHFAVNALTSHFDQALPYLFELRKNPKERTRFLAADIVSMCIMRNEPEDKQEAMKKVWQLYNTLNEAEYKKRIIFYVSNYPFPINLTALIKMMNDEDREVCSQAYASIATHFRLIGPPNFIECSSDEFKIISEKFEKWFAQRKKYLEYDEDEGIIDTRTGDPIYEEANKFHKSLKKYVTQKEGAGK